MEKIKLFDELLKNDQIDLLVLQGLCFSGIPDNLFYRPLCWQILLRYLPLNFKEQGALKEYRNQYETILESLLNEDTLKNRDHPLNSSPNSFWTSYFKDNEVLLQINKDVKRLCDFFQNLTKTPIHLSNAKSLTHRVNLSLLSNERVIKNKSGVINFSHHHNNTSHYLNKLEPDRKGNICDSLNGDKSKDEEFSNGNSSAINQIDNHINHIDGSGRIEKDQSSYQEYHWEVCQRILFAYAKLNPGQGYIQGMNEILGPIYYVMATNRDENRREYAEHDSFYCFTRLMSELRDNFTPHLDMDKNHGIGAQMIKLNDILNRLDPRLLAHFKSQELHLNYFCYRWLMLLFSQEFKLPDVIRLWDSILSTNDKMTFCLYISTAMLLIVRDELLSGDFSRNLKLLQNYPDIDIRKIISKSLEIEEYLTKPHEFPATYQPF